MTSPGSNQGQRQDASVHVWLVGAGPMLVTIARSLEQRGVRVSRDDDAPADVPLALVDCTRGVASARKHCARALDEAPDASRLALVRDSSHRTVAAAFAAGADDFVALDKDPVSTLEAISQHVRLVLQRRGVPRRTSDVHVPFLPAPVVATPSAAGVSDASHYGFSCVVSPGGRLLRWSTSLQPHVDAAESGSFFELIDARERPVMRNAALLLMAGEDAVDVDARLDHGGEPVRWHLVLHPEGDRLLALGTPATPSG